MSYYAVSSALGDNAGTGQPLASPPSATNWTHAYTSWAALLAAQTVTAGDTVMIDKAHTFASTTTAITFSPESTATGLMSILCVDPSTNALAIATQDTETTTTVGFTISTAAAVNQCLFIHGLQLHSGTGSNQPNNKFTINGSNTGRLIFSACSFYTQSTSTSMFAVGGASNNPLVDFYNCTFKLGDAANYFNATGGRIRFFNCKIDSAGGHPTLWFNHAATATPQFELFGCDFSSAVSLVQIAAGQGMTLKASNCAIGTNYVTGTHLGYNGPEVECLSCGNSSGPNILGYFKQTALGTIVDDQTVYLTTGGAQGTNSSGAAVSYSHKLTPNALCNPAVPLYTPWYAKKVAAGSHTATIHVAHTESAVLTDVDVFLEVDYMGGAGNLAGSPDSELATTAPVVSGTLSRDILAAGSNLTDHTGTTPWTGIAEKAHTLTTASLTVDYDGYIRCRVGLTKNTTNPVYVDPKITVA